MAHLIRESNQDDKDLIYNFNKELESNGINFGLSIHHFYNIRMIFSS